MKVYNCFGAYYGDLENDGQGCFCRDINFYPKKDWGCGYTAHQLEEIAKHTQCLRSWLLL